MPRYLLAVAILTTLTAVPARAQSVGRFYTGAGIGSFAVKADEVDGRAPSASILGGIAAARHVDIEVEAVFPTDSFTKSYTAASVSFAPPGAPQAERDRLSVITRFDKSREVTSCLSAVAVIHPPLGKRVTPGFIVGLTNQRVRDRTAYTPVSIPDGVDPQHPAVVARVEESTHNVGGPTLGGQVAIAITQHVFIVPDVRYDYGSLGDEINNTWRTSVRLHWRF